jgi:hypothetical protein
VTSQGSDFGRFRRALDSGNLTVALVEARQLQHVGLGEALELVLLIRDQQPEKFTRAALRWHSRYFCDQRDVDLTEAQAVLGLLAGLQGRRPKPAAEALASLVHRRGLRQTSEALMRWAG